MTYRSSIQKDITLEIEVDYVINPAEPDVGIMHPYVDELTFINPKTGKSVPELEDILGERVLEDIHETLLQENS